MIMLAAFAVLAAAQSPTPPPGWNNDEVFCVYRGMKPSELYDAADAVYGPPNQTLQRALAEGERAAALCAATWKWDEVHRKAAVLIGAAFFAKGYAETHLPAGTDKDKLLAALKTLPAKDIQAFGLTPPPATEAEAAASVKRINETLAKAGVTKAGYADVIRYLKALVRYSQAETYWVQLLGEKKP